jgi:hypothetical protein
MSGLRQTLLVSSFEAAASEAVATVNHHTAFRSKKTMPVATSEITDPPNLLFR